MMSLIRSISPRFRHRIVSCACKGLVNDVEVTAAMKTIHVPNPVLKPLFFNLKRFSPPIGVLKPLLARHLPKAKGHDEAGQVLLKQRQDLGEELFHALFSGFFWTLYIERN